MSAWIEDRFAGYARIMLMLGLWLGVAVRFLGTNDIFNLSKITVLWLFGIASALFCFTLAAQRRAWLPRLRLWRPGAAFLVAMVLATVFSRNWRVSLVGNYGRYHGLIPHLLYALIAILVVALYWEKPLDLKDVARLAVWWVLVNAGFVVMQKLHIEGINWSQGGAPTTYPVGTLGNSDFAGAALGIALPFCLYAVVTARYAETRAFLIGVVILDVICLLITGTRGGLVAAVAGVGTMLFLYRASFPRWARLAAVVVACLGATTVFVAVVHPGMREPPKVLQVSVLRSHTLLDRIGYWEAGLRVFGEHPILGTGLSTYYEFYPRVRAAREGANLGLNVSDEPHNVFVSYASDSGLAGIATYLALLGLALWYAGKRLRALEGVQRHLLIGFVATLAAYLAQSFFSIDVPPLAVVPWVVLGGIACLADPGAVAAREAKEAQEAMARAATSKPGTRRRKAGAKASPTRPAQARTPSPTRWLVHGALLVAAAGLAVVGVLPLVADHIAHQASEPLADGRQRSPGQMIAKYRRAAQLMPLESTYPITAGRIAKTASDVASSPGAKVPWLREAEQEFQAGLRLVPDAAPLMSTIAQGYSTWAAIDPSLYPTADAWWRRTVALDPVDWEVHDGYAAMLAGWAAKGHGDARAEQIRQLLVARSIRPGDVNLVVELAGAYRGAGNTKGQRQALEQALKLDPSDKDVSALMASLSSH